MSDDLRERIAEAIDDGLFRMHGITSSCKHLDEADAVLAVVQPELDRLAAYDAECDKVGVPYDPPGLVRHHRANAGLAAAVDASTENYLREKDLKAERDEALAEVARLRATVGRVEALADEWATVGAADTDDLSYCADELRDALRGPDGGSDAD